MRKYFMLMALCFGMAAAGFAQKLTLEKASPFTAVKWEEDQPIVQFDNAWYALIKLDGYTSGQLLDFCKKEFGDKWQKRFSEDLVEVLKSMGAEPEEKVKLVLSDGNQRKNVIAIYTLENRQKVLMYNNSVQQSNSIKEITVAQAIEDIEAFQKLLEEESSYIQVSDYDYKNDIDELKTAISVSKGTININFLTHELAKIMAEIGDRHSSVRNEALFIADHPTYRLQLPFTLAPLNNKVVALEQVDNGENYAYLHEAYPYVKSINGLAIEQLIDSLVYRSKKAPKEAKLSMGVSEIQQLGRIYFINNLKLPEQIEVTFTDGENDKKEPVQLLSQGFDYKSKLERDTDANSENIGNGDLGSMARLLESNIGYIRLPQMYHYDDVEGLEDFLINSIQNFSNTKALIIDIRNNPGGVREILQTFASYIVQPKQSPWVANVAYLRTEERNAEHESMSGRFLYPYASKALSDLDRTAIDSFTGNFTTDRRFDAAKFSKPHYMVLKSGEQQYTHPVYILVNEHSFSAATVFTSAFKGLPNVKIVGVTTDGSSGNSKTMFLQHSNIRIKVSTMLSFQRNGKTLDGNGTTPDIVIPTDEAQVLKGEDSQLKALIKLIK